VIHTAALTDQSIADYNRYETINIGGTRNLINAAKKHSVKKIIYISTANAFGYGTKSEPGNETMPARFPYTLSGYARSKMKAQEIILEEFKFSDTSVTVVNPTFMIGPNDQKPGSNRIILRALDKKFLFIPPGGKNFIHVGDAAVGTCNAIDMGKDGECYILAGENLSYKEFYLKVARVAGENPVNIIIPEGLLRLSGLAGNALRAAGMNTQINSVNMKIVSLGNYYSPGKATAELQLPHTSIETAIQDAISWFRNKQ
jgi:dihydroflavonol-4-reductase